MKTMNQYVVTRGPDAIVGSNSQGSDPAAYMIVTTSDDGEHCGARLVCQILYLCSSTLLSSNVVLVAAGLRVRQEWVVSTTS